jgi:hypothetical protein
MSAREAKALNYSGAARAASKIRAVQQGIKRASIS